MAPLDPDNPLSREPPVVPARPVRELPSQLQAGPTSLPQGKVPPTRPPPAAGPGPQAREWRDTPQRGQIPVGRAPPSWNSQRAPLPPRFEAEIRRHTRFRPQFKDAFDWYREHLTEGDLLFSNTTGLTDIQKILRDDANPHPGVDHHSWRPVKALGSGTYGSVVLWQRATGNCEHVGMRPRNSYNPPTDEIIACRKRSLQGRQVRRILHGLLPRGSLDSEAQCGRLSKCSQNT